MSAWDGNGRVGDLFDYKPPVGRDHPETSHAAAAVIAPVFGKMTKGVYAFAVERGDHGFTDAELFRAFPDKLENSLRPCRVVLVRDGWLVDTGQRRPNQRGNQCVVWAVPAEGAGA